MNEKIFFDGVASYKLLAKKEVGQNFLADPTTAKRIVDLLELQTSDHVLRKRYSLSKRNEVWSKKAIINKSLAIFFHSKIGE